MIEGYYPITGLRPRGWLDKVTGVEKDWAMSGPTVFISYSHKDESWKNRLVKHLGVLAKQDLLRVWDDRRIQAGQDWYQEIQKHMDDSRVAILLVSANSLTSDFILQEEVQHLLERKEKGGMPIFPIVVAPCDWEAVPWLRKMQLRPIDGRPLSGGRNHQIDLDLTEIAKEVRSLVVSPIDHDSAHKYITQSSADRSLAPSIEVAAGMATVEITINRDFDSYDSDEQAKLLSAIAKLLEITGDVRVVARRPGSVKLALELTPGQAERLLWAVNAGDLTEFGVVDVKVIDRTSAGTDEERDDPTQSSSSAAGSARQMRAGTMTASTQQMRTDMRLRMAPRMIQSMEILQLPLMALQERIDQELSENPVLVDLRESPAPETDSEEPSAPVEDATLGEFDGDGSDDWTESYGETHRPSRAALSEEADRKHDAMQNMASRPRSLCDDLSDQLGFLDSVPTVRTLAEYIIYNLDDNGFLNLELSEVVRDFGGDITLAQAEEALALVQKLDPPGIGAQPPRVPAAATDARRPLPRHPARPDRQTPRRHHAEPATGDREEDGDPHRADQGGNRAPLPA